MDFDSIPQGDMPELPVRHDHPNRIEATEPLRCCIPFYIFHAFTYTGPWKDLQSQLTVALGQIHNPDQGIHLIYTPSDTPTMYVNVGINLNQISKDKVMPLLQFAEDHTPPDHEGLYWGTVLLSHYTLDDCNVFCARRINKYTSGQMEIFWSELTTLLKLQSTTNYKPCNIVSSKRPNQLSTVKYL